jgi:hypothetical protein
MAVLSDGEIRRLMLAGGLIDEPATIGPANSNAPVRFETRAARGDPQRARALLDKLDANE